MLTDKMLRRVVPAIAAAATFIAIAATSTAAMAQEPRNSISEFRAAASDRTPPWVPATIGGIIDYLNYVNMKTAASTA